MNYVSRDPEGENYISENNAKETLMIKVGFEGHGWNVEEH